MSNNISSNTFSSATQIKSAEVNTNFTDQAELINAKALVNLTSDQSIATGTETLLAFATEIYDPGSNFDNTGGNYSFTAPVTGYYWINLQARVNTLTNAKFNSVRIKNNSTVIAQQERYASANVSTSSSVSIVYLLTATDVLQFYEAHDNGSNRDVEADGIATWANIHLLST